MGLRASIVGTWQLGNRIFTLAAERNLDLIAAGVAFYAMLAIFPAVASVVALWGFVADPAIVDEQLDVLRGVMPPEAFALLDRQVGALIAANSTTLGWATLVSLGAALWSTRAGVGALVRGLNAVYGVPSRAGFWHSLTAMSMTIVLLALVLSALVSVVAIPVALAFLPPGDFTSLILEVARWVLLLAVGISGLWAIYRYGPNHTADTPAWILPGVLLALVLWVAASWAFATYVSYFANYNRVYGSIGAVVVLLMWFFITAYAVLLGAALNRALHAKA
ncbi:MAG: YihY/virulence factor BrkB family protein [Pseudomonadota bacterium]